VALLMLPCFAEGRNHNIRQQAGLAMAMRSRNVQDRFDTEKALALEAVEARLPKGFHGGSGDAFSKGRMAEAERLLVRVEMLCRASIAA
jgi:hypothetical protein